VRFGERLPNPFAEGEMTLWFHLVCAAYKRPDSFLETLKEANANVPDRTSLEEKANTSLTHRRLPRIDGAERSPTAQAKCRSCKQPIEKGAWRIRLVFFEEGMFSPGGFVHSHCRTEYFETNSVTDRVVHFSVNLSQEELQELREALEGDELRGR
jgi:hypothetical protein